MAQRAQMHAWPRAAAGSASNSAALNDSLVHQQGDPSAFGSVIAQPFGWPQRGQDDAGSATVNPASRRERRAGDEARR
jgi:hypothetical protein